MFVFILFVSYIYIIVISVYLNFENSLKSHYDIKYDDNDLIENKLKTSTAIQIDCHPYAGIIIKTLTGWECSPKYPSIFGGSAANEIMTVNKSIVEYKEDGSKIIHNNKIDSSVVLTENPETERIIDSNGINRYRFVPNDIFDRYTGNKYISSDDLRFHLTKNICAELLINDKSNSLPDYKTGKCKCGIGYQQLAPNIFTCVPIGHFNDYVSVAKIPCVSTKYLFDNAINSQYNICSDHSEVPYKILNVSLAFSRKNGISDSLLQKINSY